MEFLEQASFYSEASALKLPGQSRSVLDIVARRGVEPQRSMITITGNGAPKP
jgi:hypothetical protein